MLDLCRPARGMPKWYLWVIILVAMVGFIGIYLKQPWLFGPAMIIMVLALFYGLFRQAQRLIRGELIASWPTGKLIRLDERQVRNDLIAVDVAWVLNMFVVIGVWYVEHEGLLPQGLWPVLVLGIGFGSRFSVRWLLDRYA